MSRGERDRLKVTLLVATRNRHKVRELRRLLSDSPVRLLCAEDFIDLPTVREDGTTFRENSVKKAVAVSRRTILPVLAEDSGLQVRALGGRPGVRSARYAGVHQKDRANVAKLLREMSGIPPSRRQARFVCVMALAAGGKLIRTFEDTCSGSIALEPRGRAGFGYDPAFIPRGFRRTMAQLSLTQKNRISHRARAARKLRDWLRTTTHANWPLSQRDGAPASGRLGGRPSGSGRSGTLVGPSEADFATRKPSLSRFSG